MERNHALLSLEMFVTPYDGCPQLYSKKLDSSLGYKIPKIEKKLAQKYRSFNKSSDKTNRKKHYSYSESWIGLHPQALQTPYSVILDLLQFLKKKNIKSLVDLGAGYGRVGIVLSCVIPNAEFIGVELLSQRYLEACRVFIQLDLRNSRMLNDDLIKPTIKIPKADAYFIYDFSTLEDIYSVLTKIFKEKKSIYIVAVGERIYSIFKKSIRSFPPYKLIYEKGNRRIFSIFEVKD